MKSALAPPPKKRRGLGEEIHSRFAAVGGFNKPKIVREPMREPPDFE
ncbi:MAG: hypothetical protein JO307_21355 [Bryobacterales bacterium]|nr:hypothetical protein [Bryobacterales bacterium]MBV9399150.1 hypothetical protein [Bryobacterales bacterium]